MWLETISEYIKQGVAGLRTCKPYEGELTPEALRKVQLKAPAVLVACLGWKPSRDQPGDGRFSYSVVFSAFVVAESPTYGNATYNVVTLAHEITHLINDKTQGIAGSRSARVVRVENLQQLGYMERGVTVWVVTWTQDIYFGESGWDDGVVVPLDVRYSIAPDIGPDHIDDYKPVVQS